MKKLKKIQRLTCIQCKTHFIPRTFHETESIYSHPKKHRFMTYKGYFNEEKPSEVIYKTWITYCPHCNYIVSFVKGLATLKKTHSTEWKNFNYRYEEKEIDKPFLDYYDYLEVFLDELFKNIEKEVQNIDLNSLLELYKEDKEKGKESRDYFKFLVKFMAKIEKYYESLFGIEKEKNMPEKIKEVKFSHELEEILIKLNSIRNDVVHNGEEISNENILLIEKGFMLYLEYFLVKYIIPLAEVLKNDWDYEFLDSKEINKEFAIYLKRYFWNQLGYDNVKFTKIRKMIDELLIQ